jgi:hypothetical protein
LYPATINIDLCYQLDKALPDKLILSISSHIVTWLAYEDVTCLAAKQKYNKMLNKQMLSGLRKFNPAR